MLRTLAISTGAIFALANPAGACSIWVSPTGSDSAAGTSTAPLRTLNRAANLAVPGSVVCAMTGTYADVGSTGGVLDIRKSGTAAAPITFKAAPGARAIIAPPATIYNGILIQGSSYIVVDGFEVKGLAPTLNSQTATGIPANQNGIGVNRFGSQPTPHHLVIKNNKVYDFGCSGISVNRSDYVTIEHNTTYRNGYWSSSACSGISLYQSQSIDGANAATKNYVIQNLSYENKNVTGPATDGNGIIIDDNRNTQNGSTAGEYQGRTYVANNVVARNGGSGIHAFYSRHVDFVNNTAFQNYWGTTNTNGEIFGSAGTSDIWIANNIMVGAGGSNVVQKARTGNTFTYNLYWGGTTGTLGSGDIKADPGFISSTPGSDQFLYISNAGAAASNNGTTTKAPSIDRDYTPRTTGPDRGAYVGR